MDEEINVSQPETAQADLPAEQAEHADLPTEQAEQSAPAEQAEQSEALPTEDAATADAKQSVEEGPKDGKKKRNLPPFIKKIVDYLKAHEDVRQMVLFFLFSLICGASQLIITYALSAGLKLEAHLGSTRLDWFVFHYATQAEFIGFLVGSVVGQVLTFILNRKKTFNVPNYIAMRAIMYAVMAILIIIMQTYLGGLITNACWQAKPDANGFLDLVFNLTGQAVAGIAALIINFLGNKFFVMRDWGGKIKKANEEKARLEAEAAVAADIDATASPADPEAPQAEEAETPRADEAN